MAPAHIKVYNLDSNPDNIASAEALAALAWVELKEAAEKDLPILVLENGNHVSGVPVVEYLKERQAK